MRDHIDYITPGVAVREVTGVSQANKRSLDKRRINGGPASILPIAQGLLDELLGGLGLLDLCDVAVTPDCIQSRYYLAAHAVCVEEFHLLIIIHRDVQHPQGIQSNSWQ